MPENLRIYFTAARFCNPQLLHFPYVSHPLDQSLCILVPKLLEIVCVKVGDGCFHLLQGCFELRRIDGLLSGFSQHFDGSRRRCPGAKKPDQM